MAAEKELEINEHKHDHHDHEGHDHHDHQHGSDSDDEKHGVQEGDKDKKANRGEKKFKKAMVKMGMKQVTGISRVTIKKGKQFLLYIDEPEVFKSAGVDNSYIVFGEAKMNDAQANFGANEASGLQKPEQVPQQPEKKVEQVADEEDDNTIPADSIKMVMDHCKCDRKAAVSALKESAGDTVTAILKLTT